jgi:hypothetical protein
LETDKTKTNPTPGPWKSFRGHKGSIGILGDGLEVARVLGKHTECGPRDPEVQAANARLVAAAPEMLDLLERLHWIITASADEAFIDVEASLIELLTRVRSDAK